MNLSPTQRAALARKIHREAKEHQAQSRAAKREALYINNTVREKASETFEMWKTITEVSPHFMEALDADVNGYDAVLDLIVEGMLDEYKEQEEPNIKSVERIQDEIILNMTQHSTFASLEAAVNPFQPK
jgi:hypothetical protein